MKIQRILNSLILTTGLLLANVSTAFAIPPLPSSFYGTVKVNGANASVGAILSAWINGVDYAHTTAVAYLSETVYGLEVPGDDSSTPGVMEGGQTGDSVLFYVDGVLADQTGTWNSGSNVSLNLTAGAATTHAPTADAQSVTTAEDNAKAITLTGSDADGDPLTYSVVTGPSHGVLSGTAPNLTYTPAANYYGSDYFTFKVNDGTLDSYITTVSITVTAVNDTPVADAQSASTAEDTPKAITLAGTDADGNMLIYSIVSGPSHGALSGSAPALTYTPAANYNGPDSFTFKVNDGTVDSAPATVSITVTGVNDAPVANPDAYNRHTGAVLYGSTVLANDTDPDSGDILTAILVSGPTHASAFTFNADGTFVYTPVADYSGTDSFTYKANDGTADSNIAMVSITVTAVNNAPIITEGASTNVSMSQDGSPTPFSLNLHATDADGDSITWSITSLAGHGVASASGTGSSKPIGYTPALNYIGSDSFVVQVSDGNGGTDTIKVNVTISAVEPNLFTLFIPFISKEEPASFTLFLPFISH